jgi:fimbrial isopeptide formation D2 family protein
MHGPLICKKRYFLNATSLPETQNMSVAIGELISLDTVFTLPSGTVLNGTLRIQLPKTSAGQLHVVYGQIVHMPESMTSELAQGSNGTLLDTNDDFEIDAVEFAFGNIVISPSWDDTLVVEVLTSVPSSTANKRGVQFSTNAYFTYNNATSAFVITPPAIGPFVIIEPSLTITKTARPLTGVQAGTPIYYSLVIDHTAVSNAPAYGQVVVDLLTKELNLTIGSVTTTSGDIQGGQLAGNTSVYVLPFTSFPSDPPINITYSATVNTLAQTNSNITNVATLYYFSTTTNIYNGPDVRGYTSTSSQTVQTIPPSASFDVISTSLSETSGFNVAIGETITFSYVLTLPHGTTANTTVAIAFSTSPGKLDAVNGVITSMDSNFFSASYKAGSIVLGNDTNHYGFNNSIVFNFGNIVNTPNSLHPGTNLTIEVVAVVLDVPQNANGVVLTATPTWSYMADGIVYTPKFSPSVISFTVVGPVLSITKTVATPTPVVMAGDVVTYTVTVMHTSKSTSDAFDTRVVDKLSPELALVNGTVKISRADCSIVSGLGENDTTVDVLCHPYLEQPGSLTITYNVTLTPLVAPNSLVPNTALVTYSTYPSNETHLRNASATAKVQIATPTMDFMISSSSLTDMPDNMISIGETVTFQVSFDLPLGTMPNTTLTIYVPDGNLGILSGNITSMPNSMWSSSGLAESSIISGSDVDGTDNAAVFAFGAVTNNPDETTGSTIVLQATALALSRNTMGSVLNVSVVMEYGNGTNVFTIIRNTSVTIVEPVLVFTKSANYYGARIEAGTLVTYTLKISQASNATAPSYSMVITDSLSADHVLDPSSIIATDGK